ncbi:hypothetical protein GCM10010424_14200 [Streptomyces lienomycini]
MRKVCEARVTALRTAWSTPSGEVPTTSLTRYVWFDMRVLLPRQRCAVRHSTVPQVGTEREASGFRA